MVKVPCISGDFFCYISQYFIFGVFFAIGVEIFQLLIVIIRKTMNQPLTVFKLLIIIFILSIGSNSSFAQAHVIKLIHKPAAYQHLNVNNSSLLMPLSPIGIAILIFMLIITLAFSLKRLKYLSINN